jgi:hypothetical protein
MVKIVPVVIRQISFIHLCNLYFVWYYLCNNIYSFHIWMFTEVCTPVLVSSRPK